MEYVHKVIFDTFDNTKVQGVRVKASNNESCSYCNLCNTAGHGITNRYIDTDEIMIPIIEKLCSKGYIVEDAKGGNINKACYNELDENNKYKLKFMIGKYNYTQYTYPYILFSPGYEIPNSELGNIPKEWNCTNFCATMSDGTIIVPPNSINNCIVLKNIEIIHPHHASLMENDPYIFYNYLFTNIQNLYHWITALPDRNNKKEE